MRRALHGRLPALVSAVATCALLAACERPPVDAEQQGFRGTGMESVTNPRTEKAKLAGIDIPDPLPPAPAGPPASEVYENVEVLGDLSVGEFNRLMGAITTWVSPQQGCLYCHEAGNFAAEGVYTKHVSRRMIQMTRNLNSAWTQHVKSTGVTCYTCHRGQPVPANVWVQDPGPEGGFGAGWRADQNLAASAAGLASLPYDPFSPYLADDPSDIRVQSNTALPVRGANPSDIKDTEKTYSLMMHLSTALGVNCTYCHNSRAFSPWEESSPPRITAWHGIRMVREINDEYISPLADVLPPERKGPAGDPLKANCTTCHQGLPKPLMGISMLEDYPELSGAHGPG